MNKQTLFVTLSAAVLVCGCQSSKVKISGRFVGSDANNVYLEDASPLRQAGIDWGVLAGDGSYRFELKGVPKTPSLYNIIYNGERIPLLIAGGDRVTRTEVRSPVRGSLKQILVYTEGGVVKPGEPIKDIVPMDESLLVEVRVRPQDVAFLRPGQDVMIKVSAYDFSIYGGLPGKLESISADTIEDKKGDFYYLVKVRTGETAIRRNDEILPIIPGMIVVADIIIGKKTVLDYILKPVMKARQNALTER